MTFSGIENLRGFFTTRPPLVVFMICLASFAVTLITFAYIVKTQNLPDPDVKEDWNTILEKFSNLQFCIPHNEIAHNTTLPKLTIGEKNAAEVFQNIHEKVGETLGQGKTEDKEDINYEHGKSDNKRDLRYIGRRTAEKDGSVSTITSLTPESSSQTMKTKLENVTVSLSFIYIPSNDATSALMSAAHFVAAATAHQLKLDVSAKVKGDEQLSVFLSFPQNLTEEGVCEEKENDVCLQYRVPGCVTFQGPSRLLPKTQKPNAEQCAAYIDTSPEGSHKILVGTLTEATQSEWCQGGSHLLPQYTLDDSLTVFLSMHDKSAINMHLMRTSYFLFVMVITLFCYALIKGRPNKIVKTSHITYEKVSTSA